MNASCSSTTTFLLSDIEGYRALRQLLTGAGGISAILRETSGWVKQDRAIRADQYGIRTMLRVAEQTIKFELVLEARIALAAPKSADDICGIATLTPLDMATTKLLANSDRWADDGVFSRDVIDLAMMNPRLPLLREAVAKAEAAYGPTITQDLDKVLQRLQDRQGWLERCMLAMAIELPKAMLWQRLRALRKVLP